MACIESSRSGIILFAADVQRKHQDQYQDLGEVTAKVTVTCKNNFE